MGLGGGSSRSPVVAAPPPAPTIVTPGLEKARLDLLERMRRASSRQDSRVTLNMLQPTFGMPKATNLGTSLSGSNPKTATQLPMSPTKSKFPEALKWGIMA